MDERQTNSEKARQESERHLRLVPPPATRSNRRRFSWPLWASLGMILLALTLPMLLRSPEPGGDTVHPIGFQSERQGASTELPDLEDGIQLVQSALITVQPSWNQAADRTGSLQRRWLELRPSLIENGQDRAWTESDITRFDTTLESLSKSITREDLAQARADAATLGQIVRRNAQT